MSVELAYLAGFFDGEGSLGNWRSGTGRTFMMSVGNTNRAILEDYQRHFGGTVTEKASNNGFNKKPMWMWRVCGDEAWNCYYALRPYLRQKIWKNEPTA